MFLEILISSSAYLRLLVGLAERRGVVRDRECFIEDLIVLDGKSEGYFQAESRYQICKRYFKTAVIRETNIIRIVFLFYLLARKGKVVVDIRKQHK